MDELFEMTESPEERDLRQRKADLAARIGEDEERISTVALDISRMLDMGVLVDIDVHGTSLFSARANWADVSIPESDTRRKRIRLGRKDFYPEFAKKFRSLEVRFRQSLERHSFPLKGFLPFRFVPFTAYESWCQEWRELEDEMAALKAEFEAEYKFNLTAELLQVENMAREAWASSLAQHSRNNLDTEKVPVTRLDETAFHVGQEETFVQTMQQRFRQEAPTPSMVNGGVYVNYRNAMLITSADMAAEALREAQLSAQRAEEYAAQRKAYAQARLAEEEAEAQARQLEMELEEEQHRAYIRKKEREQKLQAMREAELEHAREQLAKTVNPLDEIFTQLRAQIYADVKQIRASLADTGYLRGKVAERTTNLIETFRLLNAHGDAELEAALDELERRMAVRPDKPEGKSKAHKYDAQLLLNQMGRILEITHHEAEAVLDDVVTPTRARALEL